MLVVALDAEVATYLEAHREERHAEGRALVVSKGKGRTRKVRSAPDVGRQARSAIATLPNSKRRRLLLTPSRSHLDETARTHGDSSVVFSLVSKPTVWSERSVVPTEEASLIGACKSWAEQPHQTNPLNIQATGRLGIDDVRGR
jgi:hypothetical protein